MKIKPFIYTAIGCGTIACSNHNQNVNQLFQNSQIVAQRYLPQMQRNDSIARSEQEKAFLLQHEQDSVKQIQYMIEDFNSSNIKIDQINYTSAIKSPDSELNQLVEEVNTQSNKRLGMTNGSAAKYQNVGATTNTYICTEKEVMNHIVNDIKLANKEIDRAHSLKNFDIQDSKSASSSHYSGRGSVGRILMPILGYEAEGQVNNGSSESSYNCNKHYDYKRTDKVLSLVNVQTIDEDHVIIDDVNKEIALHSPYRKMAQKFIESAAKKKETLAQMQEGLNNMSKKLTHKSKNAGKSMKKYIVSMKFFTRAKF